MLNAKTPYHVNYASKCVHFRFIIYKMCQVTNDNYEQLYPEICSHIDSCSFLAFDCEFTALRADSSQRNSLFDDVQTRFTKLSQAPVQSIISQFGLAIFQQNVQTNTYFVRTYNFYICPKSFASVDDNFVCQSSSLEFLKRYNFDFNKFLYKGISYLNSEKEKMLRQDLRSGLMLCSSERNLPLQDEDSIRKICAQLAIWIVNR